MPDATYVSVNHSSCSQNSQVWHGVAEYSLWQCSGRYTIGTIQVANSSSVVLWISWHKFLVYLCYQTLETFFLQRGYLGCPGEQISYSKWWCVISIQDNKDIYNFAHRYINIGWKITGGIALIQVLPILWQRSISKSKARYRCSRYMQFVQFSLHSLFLNALNSMYHYDAQHKKKLLELVVCWDKWKNGLAFFHLVIMHDLTCGSEFFRDSISLDIL